MPRESYQRRMADLRAAVVEMGHLVVGRLEDALAAIETGDETLATEVIDGDDVVNDRYLALEGDCIDLLALQQPVASDLRFISSTFKILTDIERIGDLATNLGVYAKTGSWEAVPAVEVVDIGRDAVDLVERSLDAYANSDVEATDAIAAEDDDIDAACQRASEQVVRDLVGREADADLWDVEGLLDDVTSLLLTVRDLERVADHGVNIAARTRYMVDNDPALLY